MTGLFDQMAATLKAQHTKPDGWLTLREFVSMAGGGVTRDKAERMLQSKVDSGVLEKRKWVDSESGKQVNIYGEPTQ